jgi:HD-GYP domain-containing protein (c-di-GMP phosphodiesterase class II)
MMEIAQYILFHHERFDGTGYPRGLKREEIPLLSRIIAVADAYDAMTNARTYKKALDKDAAIKELIQNKGTQFDPHIVDVFIEKVLNNV